MTLTLEQLGPIVFILLGIGMFAIKSGKSMFYGVDAGARVEEKIVGLVAELAEVRGEVKYLSGRIDLLMRSHGEPR